MISELVLKYLKGERLVISRGYASPLPASSQVPLTKPGGLPKGFVGKLQKSARDDRGTSNPALKPGGRLAISDVVAVRPMPDAIRNDEALQCACIGGAASVEDLRHMLENAGFEAIRIKLREESRELIKTWAPGQKAEDYVVSADIEAVKPGGFTQDRA